MQCDHWVRSRAVRTSRYARHKKKDGHRKADFVHLTLNTFDKGENFYGVRFSQMKKFTVRMAM